MKASEGRKVEEKTSKEECKRENIEGRMLKRRTRRKVNRRKAR